MGVCFSTTKVSGSNSNTPSTTVNNHQHHRPGNDCTPSKPASTTTTTTSSVTSRKQGGSHYNHHKTKESHRNPQKRNIPQIVKNSSKRPGGIIPCGKRTDFGYDKDFDNRYTIGKLLGHGQFGYTYVAIDKSNGDRVAVKKIEKNKMVLPIAVEDVKREVKILKALAGHENVVQFHNSFEDDSYVYIVMELCEGGELLDRILSKKDSRYTEKDAAIIVRQMLKVAAECHLHGLVHRDMKPENFLFKSPKEDSPLKATDFGLSDFIRPGKKFQDIVGSAYYVAPEVLKRKSGPESDVWSIGVITYILLCGRRPFWDKTEDGIFKEVLRNKPDFRRKPWPSISNAAKDFVKKLLVKDPRARLTAAQALSHPWVREGGEASEIPLDISVLNNMRKFVKYSRLKQFALRALASTLDEEELADLRDQFDAIDVDKNGSISLEEMRQALAKDLPWKMKDSRVLEILQAIDSNTDGLVDFSEFVAATLHVHQLEEHNSEKWQQRSRAAFEKFDVDRDGFITTEELKMHTCLRGSIDPLLEEADIDKDGKISLSEFRRLLRTASLSSRNVTSSSVNRGKLVSLFEDATVNMNMFVVDDEYLEDDEIEIENSLSLNDDWVEKLNEIALEVGMKFKELDEIFEFYKNCASRVGFPFKKCNSRKGDDGLV
ncbi:Calcium-dependent protein kinase 16 [Abeliophyllum distichum]|uniref:non-specific serine/threonine protein kinase n=1 Tax=Abeliophyllum distichum TaxID=126358 RepID=A0ABD1V501_9LAMI